ncbi:hypothetical protein ACROYT_G017150 [Oculina patagonica]
MRNITTEGDEDKLRRFEFVILILNGCFSLLLSVTICFTNIVLIFATAKNPLRFDKVIDKIHKAFFYANLMAGIMFLPYFGIAEILHGLEITATTIHFPSYLSSTFFVFAQANVQVSLFISIERCAAFISPYLHRRMTTKRRTFITLFITESFLLLFVCSSFAGVNENVFYTVYIHVFFSFPMLLSLIMTFVTYWKLKHKNRVVSDEIPQPVEKLELHRKHSTRTARKYLKVVSLFLVPLSLCILPWYIVKIIEVKNQNPSSTTEVEFFWQRFSISLLFLPDVLAPITLTLRFEAYYNSVKRLILR